MYVYTLFPCDLFFCHTIVLVQISQFCFSDFKSFLKKLSSPNTGTLNTTTAVILESVSWKWEIPRKWCTTQHRFQHPAPPLEICIHFHLHFHIYYIYHQSCGKLQSREIVWHGSLMGRSISKWSFSDHGETIWEHSIATHRSVNCSRNFSPGNSRKTVSQRSEEKN